MHNARYLALALQHCGLQDVADTLFSPPTTHKHTLVPVTTRTTTFSTPRSLMTSSPRQHLGGERGARGKAFDTSPGVYDKCVPATKDLLVLLLSSSLSFSLGSSVSMSRNNIKDLLVCSDFIFQSLVPLFSFSFLSLCSLSLFSLLISHTHSLSLSLTLTHTHTQAKRAQDVAEKEGYSKYRCACLCACVCACVRVAKRRIQLERKMCRLIPHL